MKTSIFITAALIVSVSLYCTQSFAQSKSIAADPQKQAGLEKNKAHQAEMKKKYNAMSPAQQAEARKHAEEYKKGGYKYKSGKGTTAPANKPASAPAAKPAQSSVSKAKPAQAKSTSTTTQGGTKPKPVFLDANGKPVSTAAPVTPAKPAVSPAKTTTTSKTEVIPSKTTSSSKTEVVPAKTSTSSKAGVVPVKTTSSTKADVVPAKTTTTVKTVAVPADKTIQKAPASEPGKK